MTTLLCAALPETAAATLLPPGPEVPTHLNDCALYTHQRANALALYERPRVLLADPPGMGKTASVMALLRMLSPLPTGRKGRCLWVTESGLIEQAMSEAVRFLPDVTFRSLDAKGIRTPSRAGLTAHPQVDVTSYQMVHRCRDGFDVSAYGLVFFDEVSHVKGGGALFDSALTVSRHASRVICATATPVEVEFQRLRPLLRLLHAPGFPPGEADFDRMCHRREHLAPSVDGPVPFTISELREDCAEEARSLIAPYLLRTTPQEAGLDLPELDLEVVRVSLGQVQMTAYREAERIRSWRLRFGRLDKACDVIDGESAKADAAVRIITETSGQVILYAPTREMLDAVELRLSRAGEAFARIDGHTDRLKRDRIAQDFRAGVGPRVLTGTVAMCHGLNLQSAGTAIALTNDWNPAVTEQFWGRIVRIGSTFDRVRGVVLATDTPHEAHRLAKAALRTSEAHLLLRPHTLETVR